MSDFIDEADRPTRAVTEIFRATPEAPPAAHPGWENFAPTTDVRAIAVTLIGEVWAATPGGVLAWRRHETTYRRYTAEHGPAGNAAGCLAADAAGRVWAGHPGGGLSVFAGGRWRPVPGRAADPVRAVAAADAGVWFATADGVFHLAAPDADPVPAAAGGGDAAALADALLADGDGVLVGNEWGLARLSRDRDPVAVAGTPGGCTALARDARGGAWAAAGGAVWRVAGGGLESPVAPAGGPVFVRSLAAGGGSVWAGTAAGVGRVQDGAWAWAGGPAGVVAAGPLDSFAWAGTARGLAQVWFAGDAPARADGLLAPHPDDALGPGRAAAAGPDGTVYVGTGRGLAAFPPAGGPPAFAPCGDVRAVAAGETVWGLARPGGVGVVAGGVLAFTPPQPPGLPLTIAAPPGGRLHALTTAGLWRLDPGGWEPAGGPADADHPTLLVAGGGEAWLGTARGAYRLAGGGWALAGESPGPRLGAVTGLAAAGGRVWAAAESGLWERAEGGWRPHAAGPARAVGPGAGGRVWFAGPAGLSEYDPAAGRVLRTFTPRDSGLGDGRVAAVAAAAGRVYAATAAGVSRYTPAGGAG